MAAPFARSVRHIWTAALAALLALAPATAWSQETLESAIKATFIYKFAGFVTWPAGDQAGPFQFCVYGDDAVSDLLPQAVKGQSVGRRPVALRKLDSTDALDGCRVLYVGGDATGAERFLSAAKGKPILTVSEGGDFDRPHGIIGFTLVDGHVRFDIDAALAHSDGLSISSKLLSLAHAVEGPA